MKTIFSIDKQYYQIYDNSLYAFSSDNSYLYVDSIDLNNLQTIGQIKIKCSIGSNFKSHIDDSSIYFLDHRNYLWSIDRFSGEVFFSISLKSICISNFIEAENSLYILAVLPLKISELTFDKYFIIQINKDTGQVIRMSFKIGKPNTTLFIKDNQLFYGDENNLYCESIIGKIVWHNSFPQKMDNRLVCSNKYIICSSISGNVKCFDINSGKNIFNIQIKKTECAPQIINDNLFWLDANGTFKIDIIKLSKGTPNWQSKINIPINNISCAGNFNNSICVGNIEGEIFINQQKEKVSKECIISIKQLKDKVVCETPNQILLVEP